ncbi:hypothetical protein ACFW0H_07665 [Pseudomonas sp. CR3202]|uniref:hypothetical protein n=1 Tax=Pseudomonas sp. CR3202 TaxID=3351532 RepID=UPI003BEFEB4C
MKINKIAAVVGLVIASSGVHANGSGSISGVIHFTGAIVVGACDMPASEWYRHAGRDNGISPKQAGPVPPSSNLCAGIVDTSSIKSTAVAHTNGKIVTVTFN